MDQFVLVRLTRADRFDLSLLQFDPDLSFAVFFINADKTMYGRFGTRSDFYEAQRDISIEGLNKAMQRALEWHRNYATMRPLLQAKRNPNPKYERYSSYPTVEGRRGYRRASDDSNGRCTHCHDLRTAEQKLYLAGDEPMPDNVIFAWPMPSVLGLELDPHQIARVSDVHPGSVAEQAGLRAGDDLVRLDGQPLLSIADVQWVLQNSADEGEINVQVRRGDDTIQITLKLGRGWRHGTDIAWRTTTRYLRERLLDGILFRELAPDQRRKQGLKDNALALQAIRGVSRTSDKPIRRGDVIVEIDGSRVRLTESQLLAYFAQQVRPKQEVRLKVLRNGEVVEVVQSRK